LWKQCLRFQRCWGKNRKNRSTMVTLEHDKHYETMNMSLIGGFVNLSLTGLYVVYGFVSIIR
jgi:hypothetical protein